MIRDLSGAGCSLIVAAFMVLSGIGPHRQGFAQEPAVVPVSAGKCLEFDGIDDVVNGGDVSTLDSSQQLTAEMWVRIDKFDAWRTFFGKFKNLSNRIQFQQYSEPGKIALCVNNNADIEKEGNQAYYHTPGAEVTIGDWFHLAMVFDGTLEEEQRVKLYINGMLRPLKKEALSKGSVPTHTPATDAPLLLGAEKPSGAYGFKGLMDEIRIWTIARSADQIRVNMERQLTGTEEGLRLYYPVDGETGTEKTLLDKTSGKQAAEMVNFDMKTCYVNREVAVPATAASEPHAEEPRPDAIRIAWVRGSGSANLVFATDRETGLPQPQGGVTYTADPEYGKGSRIGETHWYCVYNGYDAAASIDGLSPQTSYRLSVVDYNGSSGSERYKTDSMVVVTFTTAAAPEKKTQHITFNLDSVMVEDHGPVLLSSTASSGLPVSYSSADTARAQIDGTTLTIRGPGTVRITASQPGDAQWLAAADVTKVLVVKSAPKPSASTESPPAKSASKLNTVKPLLIGGGALVLTGAVIGIVAALAGGTDDGGSGAPTNAADRPPQDPSLLISP